MIQRAPGVIIAARYRLVRPLGVGGMGMVWLAQDLLLDSNCALKLIDDEKAQSEEVRIRFAREAKVSAQLRGAHVVDVFEHGEWEGTPFIAMEYLEGEDLGSRLDRLKVLDPESTYRVVAHVARALARAHAVGIVHRDLKPENIFLISGDDGEIAKVLDFGIAKHDAYSLRDKATKTGSFLGTPFYVSPEQARGKEIDHRSDLWSLGVIAFQCLTGKPPFESEALGELMGLILYENLPKPTERRPELPPAIDAWWERAAARDRDQRFQSAKELADALGEALGVEHAVAVPSLAPGRSSIPDMDPPLAIDAPLPRLGNLSPSVDLRFTPPSEPLDERTDAPLSHTRHSAIPVVTRFRSAISSHAHPRQWRAFARSVPRRHLAGAAIVGGITLGILLTFVVTSQKRPELDAAPAAALGPTVVPVAPAADLEAPSIPPPPAEDAARTAAGTGTSEDPPLAASDADGGLVEDDELSDSESEAEPNSAAAAPSGQPGLRAPAKSGAAAADRADTVKPQPPKRAPRPRDKKSGRRDYGI